MSLLRVMLKVVLLASMVSLSLQACGKTFVGKKMEIEARNMTQDQFFKKVKFGLTKHEGKIRGFVEGEGLSALKVKYYLGHDFSKYLRTPDWVPSELKLDRESLPDKFKAGLPEKEVVSVKKTEFKKMIVNTLASLLAGNKKFIELCRSDKTLHAAGHKKWATAKFSAEMVFNLNGDAWTCYSGDIGPSEGIVNPGNGEEPTEAEPTEDMIDPRDGIKDDAGGKDDASSKDLPPIKQNQEATLELGGGEKLELKRIPKKLTYMKKMREEGVVQWSVLGARRKGVGCSDDQATLFPRLGWYRTPHTPSKLAKAYIVKAIAETSRERTEFDARRGPSDKPPKFAVEIEEGKLVVQFMLMHSQMTREKTLPVTGLNALKALEVLGILKRTNTKYTPTALNTVEGCMYEIEGGKESCRCGEPTVELVRPKVLAEINKMFGAK